MYIHYQEWTGINYKVTSFMYNYVSDMMNNNNKGPCIYLIFPIFKYLLRVIENAELGLML